MLFLQILEAFYQRGEHGKEYFSPEDLADIQEEMEEIRRGETVSLAEEEKSVNKYPGSALNC